MANLIDQDTGAEESSDDFSTAEAVADDTTEATGGSLRGLATGLAGMAAAGSALAAGELMTGLSDRIPSLVVSVGDFIVDTTPGSIARWSIDQFGSNQKTVLVWGITIVSLLLGGALGRIAGSRFAKNRSSATGIVIAVFIIFGLLGALAAVRAPLASTGFAWLTGMVAAAVGAAVLLSLLHRLYAPSRATVTDSTSSTSTASRRGFVNLLGGSAVVAVAAAWGGRRLRRRFAVNDARDAAADAIGQASSATQTAAEAAAPVAEAEAAAASPVSQFAGLTGLESDIEGLTPLVVPNDEFYRIDTALVVPQVDPAGWSMKITGMVDNEIELTFDDLIARASQEEPVTLSCVSNRVGGDLVGNAVWLGVPLRELLDEAGVDPAATQIVGRSVDGWTGGFPVSHLDDPDVVAMVAVGMNGEPLPVAHGFPARLVIAGLYGYVSATKWLAEVELTTLEDFDGYWIPRGWSKFGPIKTQSRIDVPLPRNRAGLTEGTQTIAGIAWAPTRSIARVELQIDDGDWVEAELADELSEHSWRQWFYDWDAPAGDHRIKVRATDGDGDVQTADVVPPAPDGATGHHEIQVRVNTI